MAFREYIVCVFLFLGPLLLVQSSGARSREVTSGARLFQMYCAACHGPKGEGGRGPTLKSPKLVRAPTRELLIKVITDGIPGTEMSGFELEPDQIRSIAAWVRSLGLRPLERAPGNPKLGEHIYSKAGCAQCHGIKGQGGAFGPDLTDIGLSRGASYLRKALTDPETDLPENFLQVTLRTKDGQRIEGVRLNEDAFSIQVRDVSGQMHSFFKTELIELNKDRGKSPMPSYGGVLSKEELDDLVAFLASLKGEK